MCSIKMFLWVLAATLSVAYGELFGSQDAVSIEVKVERCKPGYSPNPVHTKCYKLVTEAKPWMQASRACSDDGTELAIPRNVYDATFISSLIKQHGNTGSAIVGIVKWVVEGVWTDPDGAHVNSQILWATDSSVKKYLCSAIDRYGQLNSLDCHTPAVFFCEHKLKNEFIEYVNKLVLGTIQAEEAKGIASS